MSTHGTSSGSGDSAARLLRLASQSTEMIPPVKSIVDGALRIAELVVQFKTNQDEWKEFQVYVQNAVATVLHSLASIEGSQSEAKLKLEKFQDTLQGMVKRIEAKQREPLGWRMIRLLERPTIIAEMRKEVDDVVRLFRLGATIRVEITIEKIFELLQQLSKPQVPATTLNSSLNKLRVKGASWDRYRVCMEQTRQKIIKTILSWLNDTDGASDDKRICLLTGVAGSGKSTIAHTVAQQCDENRQLASSFFFHRDTGDRNNPKYLISTIAAELCSVDDRLARHIIAAVEDDERILHAPISRQFDKLILGPCAGFSAKRPLVIVLDALDEGCNQDLLRILCDDAGRLPPSIRMFVTARVSPDTETLRQKSHVRSMALDIYGKNNMDDIALFVPHKLKQVAEYHGLAGWPDSHAIASFEAKAGGLFLWVATTCDYLKMCYNPKGELHSLVSASHLSRSSVESIMDSLYTKILLACNWNDVTFVDGFRRLMGAAISTKSPLTLRALNALYQRPLMPSHLALRQLSPLLTGLLDELDVPQPVRFLHQSLPEFLTQRAGSPNAPAGSHVFLIDDKAHSGTLALLCLSLLNRELRSDMPGVGYLAKNKEEYPAIPVISERDIPEELWYACRFWVEHLLDVEPSALPDVMEQLEVLIYTKLTLWMELMAACGRYEGLSKLQEWAKNKCGRYPILKPLLYNPAQAFASRGLTERFEYMDRREEALTAARDEVTIYRRLAEDTEDGFRVGLAQSLCNLSERLIDLAFFEDAFSAAYEAVSLQRQLRTPSPGVFDGNLARALRCLAMGYAQLGKYQEGLAPIEEAIALQRHNQSDPNAGTKSDLAKSLRCLSANLYNIGRYEEAWRATQEEVDIYRRLSSDHPPAFMPELAKSLHSLSSDYSVLGHYEESLAASREAVDLRRQLAADRPAVFISDLAGSLHNLSHSLSKLGRDKEALTAIQEVVILRRQLAIERPVVFTSSLANSLHNFSCFLSNLGRSEEALRVIQEAVDLHRQLVAERPALFTSDLAESLHSLSYNLSNMGRCEEALTTTQEAVELCRQLAAERPAVFASSLADALHNLSCYLFNLGRGEEALTVIQEAVQIFRPLATNRPAVFNYGLGLALYHLAYCLFSLNDNHTAVVAIRESVELLRPLAQKYPAKYTTNLSNALQRAASYLSYMGADEESRVVQEELDVLSLAGL